MIISTLLLLASSALAVSEPELTGDWAGWAYLDDGSDFPMRLHWRQTEEELTGTWDIPPNRLSGLALDGITWEAPRIRFSHRLSGSLLFDFEGALDEAERTIAGTFRTSDGRAGQFQVHRSDVPLPGVDPDSYASLEGLWAIGENRRLKMTPRFWGEMVCFDTGTGRVGYLFPTSASTFVLGAARYVPSPTSAELTLKRDEAGEVTELSFREPGEEPIVAERVVLREEAVQFENTGVTLSGTLLHPSSSGRRAAIVYVGGSDWTTRDVVRERAELLASLGLSVLIYDRRGSGESAGEQNVPFRVTAEDARAAVRMLRKRDDIDPRRIGIYGTSRGGWIAPLAAAGHPEIAFLMLIVAPAVSPAEQETSRRLDLLRSQGASKETVAEAAKLLQSVWEHGRGGITAPEYRRVLERIEARGWTEILEPPAEADHEEWRWITWNMFHDPLPILQRLECPVLAIYGSADRVVAPEINEPLMIDALKKNENATVKVIPGADHGFGLVEEGVRFHQRHGEAPGVWPTIARWLRLHDLR
ncbi:MAG: alpha/beta fold hydrolase [Planctomycetota bacterium]